jgi:hypothetical protein
VKYTPVTATSDAGFLATPRFVHTETSKLPAETLTEELEKQKAKTSQYLAPQ